MKRIFVIVLAAMLLCTTSLGLFCCAEGEVYETRLQDLANARIGVVTGGLQAIYLPQMLPDAEFVEFNSNADAAMALSMGKIDSFSAEESTYLAMRREGQPFVRIDEPFMISEYGVLFGKHADKKLHQEFNAFLADKKEDGTLAALQEKWFGEDEPAEILSADSLAGENGTIHFVTCSSVKPYAYIKEGNFAGFDIEMMILFAREYGYRLEIADASFGGVLTGIEQGKYDMAAAGVTITEDRKKSMTFSDPYYEEDVVMIVLEEDDGQPSIRDYKNASIGVLVGSVQAIELPKLLPDAQMVEYLSTTDMAMALAAGKIDAFSAENSTYLAMRREGLAFMRLEEPLMNSNFGMLIGKGSDPRIAQDFNRFLADSRENGVLAQLEEKWFRDAEPQEFLTLDGMSGEAGRLLFAVEAGMKPFTYIKDGQFTGFDVELMILFAREYGYKLEMENATFSGILSGIEQGRYDMAGSGITITEERKQSMDFSDCYYVEDIVLVVNDTSGGAKTLADFDHAVLGVIDGSIYDGYSRTLFPEAQIDSYPSFNDLFQCVKQGKIDGFLMDVPNFSAVGRTDKRLSYIRVPGYGVEIGIAFAKDANGDALQAQMNEFLNTLRADGSYDAMWDYWCGASEPEKMPETPAFSADAQELRIVVDLSRKPFVYMLNNEYAGFEIELLYRFCAEYGYRPVIESGQWTAGVAGLKTGKYDVVSCGIYITDERRESVNFCDPYAIADVIMVFYNQEEAPETLWTSLKESFDKTFIRESRWKLIAEGMLNTLIISVFSVLGGTIFGFCVYLLARSKYRFVSVLTRAAAKIYSMVIAGTPTLVVLMLLFYIVFGKSDISAIIVAIFGFVLTFGSFVYGHMDLCVSGVDHGQMEAAYALGYTRNQTFFKLILPQALQVFLPTYTSEVIGLIKATSVVGYISVSDLTKMGDIIRSNTYEAFFPLIAVTLIYFLIIWGAVLVMGAVRRKMDFHQRKKKNILKGVVR